jgi:putative DNA primase/helicase
MAKLQHSKKQKKGRKRPMSASMSRHPNRSKTTIEIKGEGGCCLAPPSPAACHPSGRCYTFIGDKDLTGVPTITVAERQVLLDCSRALNCWQQLRRQGSARRPHAAGQARFGRPGDDFNARGDWAEILEPHGWTWQGADGAGADYWCRPGKAIGTSATANFCGSNLLFVFSSNAAPFEEWTAYNKFHAYALLAHNGNFSAAAHALRSVGYGGGLGERSRRSVKPFQRYAEYPVRLGGIQHQ